MASSSKHTWSPLHPGGEAGHLSPEASARFMQVHHLPEKIYPAFRQDAVAMHLQGTLDLFSDSAGQCAFFFDPNGVSNNLSTNLIAPGSAVAPGSVSATGLVMNGGLVQSWGIPANMVSSFGLYTTMTSASSIQGQYTIKRVTIHFVPAVSGFANSGQVGRIHTFQGPTVYTGAGSGITQPSFSASGMNGNALQGIKSNFSAVIEEFKVAMCPANAQVAARPHPLSLPAPGSTDFAEFASGWNAFYFTATGCTPEIMIGTCYFTIEYDLIPAAGTLLSSTVTPASSLTPEHHEAVASVLASAPTTSSGQEAVKQGAIPLPASRSMLSKVNDVLTNMPVIGTPLKIVEKGWSFLKGLFGHKSAAPAV